MTDKQQYYQDNRDKILRRKKEYYLKNREALIQKQCKFYLVNKDRIKLRIAREQKENPIKFREKSKKNYHKNKYKESNIIRAKEYSKKYYLEHKEELVKKARARLALHTEERRAILRQKRREKNKLRYHTDMNYRLEIILRCRFYQAIKEHLTLKYNTTFDMLGCDILTFKSHIESLWKPGMNWKNHGRHILDNPPTWQIDHIKPCAKFDLTDPEQQKQCFHYNNLQPLWSVDNLSKKDRFESSSIENDASLSNPIPRMPVHNPFLGVHLYTNDSC